MRRPINDHGGEGALAQQVRVSHALDAQPPTRRYRWVLVGACAILFAAWEAIDHVWLMRLPMVIQHSLHLSVEVLIVVAASAFIFQIVTSYEAEIKSLNHRLIEISETLMRIETTRDDRLDGLARELRAAASGLAEESEIALQGSPGILNVDGTSNAESQDQVVNRVANELLELKDYGRRP